jgi:hypothetical protein
MGNFAEQKLQFIREISALEDTETFSQLLLAYNSLLAQRNHTDRYKKKILQKFNAAAIKENRRFKNHNRAEIMALIDAMNIQEPIELLLSQLSK